MIRIEDLSSEDLGREVVYHSPEGDRILVGKLVTWDDTVVKVRYWSVATSEPSLWLVNTPPEYLTFVETESNAQGTTERLYIASILTRRSGTHSHSVWNTWAPGWMEAKHEFQLKAEVTFPEAKGWWVDIFQAYAGVWRYTK